MAKIRLKQIDNSTASASDVITYNGTNNVWAAVPGGQSNTASNVGVGGVGVFKQKTGVDLEFKNINAGSSKISITDDVGNNEIDVDVVPGNILTSELNNDANFAADQNLWETITSDSGSAVANTTTDTLTIAGGTGVSTAVSGDTLTITNDSPNVDQSLFLNVTDGVNTAVADTTTDTLTVTGGTDINVTVTPGTDTVTIDYTGTAGDPDQNLWETVTSDSGSAVANIATDTLTIAGGTGVSTAVVGDTLTITNDSPNVDQNIFSTVSDGVNSAVADTTSDTLTINGGTDINVIVTPGTDTVTIAYTGTAGDPDQNLWETITSDSGSAVADTTTDTLTIAGGTGVSTAVVGDTLTITNDSPNVDQNLFETFNLAGNTTGDTAIVADATTDTITFTGGTDITLDGNATTDVITINFTGALGDPDQNLWATVNGDAGTTTADTTTDTLIINGGSGISTAVVGDTLTITNTSPGGVQNLFETFALSGNTAGDLAIVADSTTDTITWVGGTDIQLTGSATTDTITVDFTGAVGDPDQNIWETVAGDAGSAIANTTTDTLTIAGGTGVSTTVVGDTITITNDSPNVDQNLWATINADGATTTTANTTTDTLTIAGGTNITTTIVGDTLTIDASGGGAGEPDQNLWETISGDSGSVVANITTDTLTIAGTTDEIVTAAATDTVTVGIADDPILPGTGSVTIPTGTTAQQPVTPAVGMTRYNTTLNCLEFWNGVEWACVNTGETLQGSSFTLMFSVDGILNNKWFDHGANNILSNDTFAIVPFDCELVAMTFSNSKTTAQQDIELYSAAENTLSQTLELTWSVLGRSGRNASFGVIAFSAGDKLGLYSRAAGDSFRDVAVNMFFQVTAVNTAVSLDITPGVFVA